MTNKTITKLLLFRSFSRLVGDSHQVRTVTDHCKKVDGF